VITGEIRKNKHIFPLKNLDFYFYTLGNTSIFMYFCIYLYLCFIEVQFSPETYSLPDIPVQPFIDRG